MTTPEPGDSSVSSAGNDSQPPALERYEARSSALMIVLAFAFLGLYATQVLATSLPEPTLIVVEVLQLVIWAAFLVDFGIRVWLSKRRVVYVLTHPLDIATLILPMFRPLRILRVFAAARILIERGHHVAYGRVGAAIGATGIFIVLVGALAVLDFERNAPGSTITNFGEALWWAAVTITTVGYGDEYPITPGGRIAAIAMMAVGISLIGIVTASFAGWFTQRVRGEQHDAVVSLTEQIVDLRAEIAQLRQPQSERETEP